MSRLPYKLFAWARKETRKECDVLHIPNHELLPDGHVIENETFVQGSVVQIIEALPRFLPSIAQDVLHGGAFGGVDLDRHKHSYLPLLNELLLNDDSCSSYPAFVWVSPCTFTLKNRVKARKVSLDETAYDISRDVGSVEIAMPHTERPLFFHPHNIPWSDEQGAPLALISRQYSGAHMLNQRQYSLAPMRNCRTDHEYFQRNDVVPGHEGFLQMDRLGRMSHSLHPFIAVGRLRPHPGYGEPLCFKVPIFDYVLVVLDARSRGVLSVSRVSVDFATWVSAWPAILSEIGSVVDPFRSSIDIITDTEKTNNVEKKREELVSEIIRWINMASLAEPQQRRQEILYSFSTLITQASEDNGEWLLHIDSLRRLKNRDIQQVTGLYCLVEKFDQEDQKCMLATFSLLATELRSARIKIDE